MTQPKSATNPVPFEDVEPVYVPVVNYNYLPEGIVRLEGLYLPPMVESHGMVPFRR